MRRILFLIVFISFTILGYGSHIMGGDFTYVFKSQTGTCVSAAGVTKYTVTLKIYYNCDASTSSTPVPNFQVRAFKAPNWAAYPSVNGTVGQLDSVPGSSTSVVPTCFSSSGYCVKEITYKGDISLPSDTQYWIGVAISARNSGIINLGNGSNSANYGMSFVTFIPKCNLANNSPYFLNKPLLYLCNQRANNFNQNAFDADGDSLVYSLEQPLNNNGAGSPRPYIPPFTTPSPFVPWWAAGGGNIGATTSNPFGSMGSTSINSQTGEIVITPTNIVNKFVMVVAVKEYRKINNVPTLIGIVRRDIQIIVNTCGSGANSAPPAFVSVTPIQNANSTTSQEVTAGDTLEFKITFMDSTGDSVKLFKSPHPIFGTVTGLPAPYAVLRDSTSDSVLTVTFRWVTTCPHANVSPYNFVLNVQDNYCNGNTKTFSILVKPKAVLPPPDLRCVDILNNDSIKLTFVKSSYLKDFDKYYLYRRTGSSGSCTLIDSIADSTITSYIDKNATNALSTSYGYTFRTRSTCSVYGQGCDTVNSIIVSGAKVADHCTQITWNRHRQNTDALYKIYRTVNSVKTLVGTTRGMTYIKCDCNTAGKFSIEVDDTLISCTSHSNYTTQFSNIDTTAPKAIAITRATVNTTTQIQVDFPKSDSADAFMYIIYRSSTATGTTPLDSIYASGSLSVYSYFDNSPINNGPYYYRIQVKDSCGNRSSLSLAHSPVDLTGTNANAMSKLNWVKRYVGYTFTNQILQKKLAAGAWTDYKTLNATDTFYNDTNVISCRVYYYRLKTIKSTDTTVISFSDSVQVQPFDTIRPNAPYARYITVSGPSAVTLVFDTSASMDTKTYMIYGSTNGGTFGLIDSIVYPTARPITYTWTGLNPQINTYSMYVVARDSCGNNLSVPSITHTHVQLSGTAGNRRNFLTWTNYKGRTPSTYQVQRYEVGSGSGWATIKTLNYPDTSMTDSASIKGCYTYVYRIVSSFSGYTFTSLSDTLSLIPFDLIAPGAPTIKYVSVVSNTSNKVVIIKSDSPDVNRYEIFFKSATSGWRSAGIVYYPTTNPFTFVHTGLYTPDSNYSYYVKAIDSCGSNYSVASPTHTTIQLRGTGGPMVNFLNWTKYEGWTPTSYKVLRLIGGTWTLVKTLTAADSSWADTANIKCNQPNSYKVYALNIAGDTSYSDTTIVTPYDTIRPAAPFLRSVSVASNTSVTITINKVADQDVNRYQVWYATNNGTFSLATTITYPTSNPFTYTQTGLNTLSNTYRYYIVALDSCSNNTSLQSITHRTIDLRSTPGAMTNFLYWNRYEGWASVSNYKVLRLVGGVWTLVKTLTGADTSWADTASMKCNQPNSYKVCAFNAIGDSSYSDTTIVTPYDTIHPAAPFLRSVSVLNNTSINIVINKVADQDVNRYQIWYATNNGTFSLLTTITYPSTNPFNYIQTGLNTLSNTYRYYVVAIDSCSNNVSQQSITHRSINLRSTPGAMTNFLYWNRYEGWASVSSYNVLRLIGGTWTLVKNLTGADTAWADTANMKCNQPNSYRIYALNSLGDTSYSDTTTVTPYDTIHPVAPFLRSVSVVNNTSVAITINKVPDQDVNRYQIWYATNNGTFSLVTTITYPSTDPFTYVQTGLNTLTNNYKYYVLAFDSCSNNVSQSSVVHRDIQLSSSPGNLTSKLAWTKYQGFNVGEYRVLRLIGGTWTFIQSLPGTDSTFNDTTNIGCNYTYAYRVMGINTSTLDTSYSDTTMVTPFDTIKPDIPVIKAVTVSSNTSVTITWQNSNPDVNKFRIFRKNALGVYVQIDSVYYTTTYTDKTAQPHNKIEYYKIQAVDSCSQNKSQMSIEHRTIKLNLSYQKCPKGIILNWNDYQTWPSGITSYEIYRSDSINAETLIGSVAGNVLTYTDTFVIYSTTFTYRVKAIQNAGSEISWSDSTSRLTPLGEGPYIEYVTVLSTDTLTGSIKIQWNALRYNNYVKRSILYYSSSGLPGTFSILLNNIPLSVNSYIHNNLNTKTANNYYYMVSIDSCDKVTDSISLHRSINLVLIGGQLLNVMHWSAYTGWTPRYYIMERASAYVPTFADLDTIAATDTMYYDFPAPCNVDLYYRIKAVSFDGFVSVSDTAITVAIDTLPPDKPRMNNGTVWANGVNRLDYRTADSTDVYGYALYRKTNNGNWFNIKFTQFAVPTVPYTIYDSAANTLLDYNQYVLLTIDSCLNATPSDTFNIIQLRGNPSERKNLIYWHPFKGYPIDTYQVQKWNGSAWINFRQVVRDTNCLDSPLLCNSLHYYRIWARENNGTRVTISDSIRLIPFDSIHPQPVVINYATVISNTQISLSWQLSDPDAKNYIVERKTNNGPYVPIVTLPNYPIAYIDNVGSTLQNTYSYRIIAYDTCSGNRSDTILFHTAIQLQGFPQNTQNTLNWNSYYGFGNIRKYYIQKYISGSWQIYDSVSGNNNTYVDLNQPCAQIQRYRILTYDTNNVYSVLSDTLNLTPFDTIRPAVPVIRSVSVVNNTSINISINKVFDTDVNRYQIWYGTNNGGFSLLTTIYYPTTDPFVYTQTGLNTLSNTYRYYVIAIDSCADNASNPSVIHRSINLRSQAGAMTNFLYWNRYEGWSSVSSYHVLRLSGTTWNLVKSLTGADTAWADVDSLKCNQPNSYRIFAVNASNDTSYSDTTTVTPYDTIHPAIPFLRSVSVLSNSSVAITFNKVADPDVDRYQIWYATNNGSFSLVTTISYPATNPYTVTQTGLNTLSNTYRYYVVAIDSCSNNVSQKSVTHRTMNLRSTGGAMTNFLYWNRYEGWSSVSNYYILRKSGTQWNLVKTLTGADTAWADVDSLKCNQPNSYRIYAINSLNDSSYSDTTMVTPYDTIRPKAPYIRYVTVASASAIQIVFDSVMDQDVDRYQIFESVNGGTFNLITTISAYSPNPLQYLRTGINALVNHYYYYVVALDSCSNNASLGGPKHGEVEISGVPGNMRSVLKWHPYTGFGTKYYNVQRLIGGNWTTIGSLFNNDTNYVDSLNISCNVGYYYRIQTVDLSNNAYFSLSDSVRVIPYDTIKPVAPLLKYVSVTSSNSVKVKWDLSASGDVKFYEVHRISPTGTDSYVGTAVYTDTLIDNSAPVQQNSYCYYVIAIDSCNGVNRSPKSNTLCTEDMQVVVTPGCVPLSHIRWTKCKAFDELPVQEFEVWRTVDGVTWNMIRKVPATDTAYTDSTVSLAKTYCYVIRAFNSSNTYATLSDTECVIPELYPSRPAPELDVATVSASSTTFGKIVLRWKALPATDTLIRGYRIYHSTSGGVGSFTLLTTIPNPAAITYTHSSINTYSTNHFYFIVAYDKCNFNGDSSITHQAENISILNGNLAETISWNLYAGYNVKEYEVLKSFNGVNYFSYIKTNSTTNTFIDTNVSCGKWYWYRVKAIENGGDNEIAFSDIDSVLAYDTIPPVPVVIKQATVSAISKIVGEIAITYTSNLEKNRSGYKIYRSINGSAYSLLVANNITTSGLHVYRDQGLNTLDNIYSYYIRVIDSCGNEGIASDIHTAVNVSAVAYNSSNTVSWTGYEGFNNWHYIIERYTSANPTWVAVAGGNINKNIVTWNDSAIVCDVMYYYRIKTFDDDDATASSISDTAGCLGFETYPPNLPIVLRATVTKSGKSKGEIQLDWIHSTSSDASYYQIYRRTNGLGAWSFVAQTGYVNTYKDANLNTTDNVYEYRLTCEDNCRNISAPTALHASINLTTVPGNNRSNLSWTAYKGFSVDQYEIYADGVLINNVPGTQLTYVDSMLSCDTAVVYQIKALELNGNTQVSYSDTSICTPYDIIPPAPVYTIAASVEQPENLVKLQWAPMTEWDGDHYNIYRKIGGEGWLRIYSGKSPYETTYTDKGVNAGDTNVYYKISATDNCYNTSDYGNTAKTILLRGSSERLLHKLWWSTYGVWNAGVMQYDIIKAEDNGAPYVLATVNASDSTYMDTTFTSSVHNYCYYIKAHENAGSYDAISNSNIVCLAQHPVVWIPTAFSPGSSPNLNDIFAPSGFYYEKYEELIYNRWGELMFKSTPDEPGWDGTFKGKPVPMDTYIYIIRVTGYDKQIYEQKGTVIITR